MMHNMWIHQHPPLKSMNAIIQLHRKLQEASQPGLKQMILKEASIQKSSCVLIIIQVSSTVGLLRVDQKVWLQVQTEEKVWLHQVYKWKEKNTPPHSTTSQKLPSLGPCPLCRNAVS